jgi:hypothetical protein
MLLQCGDHLHTTPTLSRSQWPAAIGDEARTGTEWARSCEPGLEHKLAALGHRPATIVADQ